MKRYIFLSVLFFTVYSVSAQIKLSNYFSDHMVLQRDQPIVVWGTGSVSEKVTVSFKGQNKTVVTDNNGDWKVVLNPEKAGGPYEMKVTGKTTRILKDILMGDVWVCSGQSNMEWKMASVENAEKEMKEADLYNIRQISIHKEISLEPLKDIQPTSWKIATPENIAEFTAVGYYFARKIYAETDIPIGLINSNWGGTNIETWISKSTLMSHKEFKPIVSLTSDQYNQLIEEQKNKMLKNLNEFQKDNIVTNEKDWISPIYNDIEWNYLHVPNQWEKQGLKDIDGIVWYRKTIELTKEQAKTANLLSLGMIDDNDETYVNGEMVGATNGYNLPRLYSIKEGLFKEGKNVIAIKVTDSGGGGGIYGLAKDVFLKIGDKNMDLSGEWKARVVPESVRFSINTPNQYPSLLYNAMIHPFIQSRIKGFIWYQGESNSGRAYQYETLFPLLIQDWRDKWQQGELPFYYVQLSSFNSDKMNGLKGSAWAELRDAQRKTLAVPHTGMAVTTDIGNAEDVHPRNKKDVGIRLALNALKNDYKFNNIISMGPLYKSASFLNGKAILSFDNIGCGLMVRNNDFNLNGFQIAGNDKVFHWANAKVVGDKVIVSNPDVKSPVAVRYGWTDVTDDINLINKEGLPASPFRTDNWDGLTKKNVYRFFESK